MDKKLKVLHVVNGLGFGGAETWLLEIMRENKGEAQFDFLLTGGVERELDNEFRNMGCQLHYVTFSAKRILAFAGEFNKIVSRGKYTVIHDHEDFVAGWHWLFILFQLPSKRICHAHNSTVYISNYTNSIGRKLFYKTGKRLNALLATHITGTSEQLMEELNYNGSMYKKKRIEPLYCGVTPGSFKFDEAVRDATRKLFKFRKEDKVIIFIGRIGLSRENEINHKNPEFAFSIARHLATKDSSFKFLFIGEKGEYGLSVESELKGLGLENNIFLMGKRNDVNQLLMAADLMLFTSTIEPFGLVLIEAQFSSLPIIASDIITRETILFPELLRLHGIKRADLNEWVDAIDDFFGSGFNRNYFSKIHEREIDDSAFSTKSSYQRLLRTYQ